MENDVLPFYLQSLAQGMGKVNRYWIHDFMKLCQWFKSEFVARMNSQFRGFFITFSLKTIKIFLEDFYPGYLLPAQFKSSSWQFVN